LLRTVNDRRDGAGFCRMSEQELPVPARSLLLDRSSGIRVRTGPTDTSPASSPRSSSARHAGDPDR